jgi:hypothetical protein
VNLSKLETLSSQAITEDNTGLDLPQDVHEHPRKRLETTVALHEAQAVPIEALCADQQFVLARIGQEVRLERRCTRSLDLRKAYDTVWRDGLFYKLLKKGRRQALASPAGYVRKDEFTSE